MTATTEQEKTTGKKRMGQRAKRRAIFYALMIFLPMLQIAVFYVGVNMNSFIMAFQKYTVTKTGYDISFAKWDNFKAAFVFLKDCGYMIKNSVILFCVNTLLGTTLALMFSFYIYKKYPMAGFFKTVLFMPQIISGLVFSLLFKYCVTNVYTWLAELITGHDVQGLLDGSVTTKFVTILVYNVWIGFGVNVLLFSGSMSGIDESIVESAQLDGANVVQEFLHITLPMIYPTIVSFLVIGLAGICTHQMSLFSMYGNTAKEIASLGYYLYLQAQTADLVPQSGYYSFGQLAAVSLVLSAIVIPTVLIIKNLLRKFGPSME